MYGLNDYLGLSNARWDYWRMIDRFLAGNQFDAETTIALLEEMKRVSFRY